ncbi:MAG: CRTAC1 family protein [Bryobacteraceae bacterium]
MGRILALLCWWAGAAPVFDDIAARAGLTFVLRNAATPEKHQIETMVGGVAVLDYDSDGRPDIFFTNGARQPDLKKVDASWWNRLYRNKGDGTFEDVTAKAGVSGEGFSIGAAAADFDNDGRTDLLVTGVDRNILYRNRGDGTFEDVTRKAGIHAEPWSVAAGWFDFDGDGWLDLFVANYVKWDPAKEPFCGDPKGAFRTYCHPKFYEGLPNTLYRNNGDGTFRDVSAESGIARHTGKGMGVAFADYDADGDLDVFVANDTTPSFLFRNEGNGRFTEVGLTAGIAFNDDGRALSSMGVDFRDVDGDGRPDLFVTALANETFPFYRNLGRGLFADVTYPTRVGVATLPLSGWGAGIYDFDNDGRKDFFAANGDVNDNTEVFSSGRSRQPNLLLLQNAAGKFETVSVGSPAMHRGAAFTDFDGDGRIDVVVTRIGGKPLLLLNKTANPHHWLGLKLVGKRTNRDAIGARVQVKTANGTQWNHLTTSVGYASSSDLRVHFGLGAADRAEVEVTWPGGKLQKLGAIRPDRYVTVEEP